MFAFAELFCSCGAALIVLLVAGALLRLAVILANKFVRPPKPKAVEADEWGDLSEWNWDDWDDDYRFPRRSKERTKVIPEPGIGKGMAIMFIVAFLSGIGFFFLGFFVDEFLQMRMRQVETRLLVAAMNLPFGFLVLSFVLGIMLPTTFWRSALVAFMYHVVVLAFTLVIGLIVFWFIAVVG